MGKSKKHQIKKLPDDLIEIYQGFKEPGYKQTRWHRYWSCFGRECNRQVSFQILFEYKRRGGRKIEVKRKYCHEHTLQFSVRFKVPIPSCYDGPNRIRELAKAMKPTNINEALATGLKEIQTKWAKFQISSISDDDAVEILLNYLKEFL